MTYPPAPNLQPVPDQPDATPAQPEYPGPYSAEITELCAAIKSAAQKSATSTDPEAVQKFGQGAFFMAQAIDKLMPPQETPDARLKAESEHEKVGATITKEMLEGRQKREHDMAVAEMQAANTSGQQSNIGAKDG